MFAVRDISALELVLVDPGTVVGPNYKSEPVCLQVGGAGGGAVYQHTAAAVSPRGHQRPPLLGLRLPSV